MGDAFLPSTVRFARKTIEWIKRRPTFYKLVYGLALRHDRSMGFRQYGKEVLAGASSRFANSPLTDTLPLVLLPLLQV